MLPLSEFREVVRVTWHLMFDHGHWTKPLSGDPLLDYLAGVRDPHHVRLPAIRVASPGDDEGLHWWFVGAGLAEPGVAGSTWPWPRSVLPSLPHPTSVITSVFDYADAMGADQTVTVRARIRPRTGPAEPVSNQEWWEQATGTYEAACAEIRDRVRDDELVLAWYVDRWPNPERNN